MQIVKAFFRPFIILSFILMLVSVLAFHTQAADKDENSKLETQMREVLENQKTILAELEKIKQDLYKIKIRIGPR